MTRRMQIVTGVTLLLASSGLALGTGKDPGLAEPAHVPEHGLPAFRLGREPHVTLLGFRLQLQHGHLAGRGRLDRLDHLRPGNAELPHRRVDDLRFLVEPFLGYRSRRPPVGAEQSLRRVDRGELVQRVAIA